MRGEHSCHRYIAFLLTVFGVCLAATPAAAQVAAIIAGPISAETARIKRFLFGVILCASMLFVSLLWFTVQPL